jgi:hypothetical protein
MKHYRAFKKPGSSDQTASSSASAVETEAAPPPPPFVLLREDLESYGCRRKRNAVHDLIDAFTDSARKLCRHDETAKQLVQHAVTTKAFRKHFDVQEPHLMRLVDAYKNMTQRHLKSVRWDRQVLLSAVVGPYPDGMSYEEIMDLFGCTRKEVYKARVHAAVYGMGVRPRDEVKWKRQRLSVVTVNFLTQCTVDQAYVYRPAHGAGKIAKDKVPQFLSLHTISHLWTLICKRRDTVNEQRKQLKLPPLNLLLCMVRSPSTRRRTAFRTKFEVPPGIKHHARISGCISSCAGCS